MNLLSSVRTLLLNDFAIQGELCICLCTLSLQYLLREGTDAILAMSWFFCFVVSGHIILNLVGLIVCYSFVLIIVGNILVTIVRIDDEIKLYP